MHWNRHQILNWLSLPSRPTKRPSQRLCAAIVPEFFRLPAGSFVSAAWLRMLPRKPFFGLTLILQITKAVAPWKAGSRASPQRPVSTCCGTLSGGPKPRRIALTEREGEWLDNHLAGVSAERHRAAENSREAADLADRVLGTLSPDDRLVLMLVDGEDMPIKEVADTTGWSQSKVKVQAFRARRRMREAVEKLLAGRKRNPSKRSTSEGEG